MSKERGIGAVCRTFRIVDAIREAEGSIGVSALAKQLNLPVSTVHSHLRTLQDCEYVVRRDQEYDLGYKFLEIGGHHRSQTRLFRFAKPKVDQLAEEFGDKVSLCVLDHGYAVYIYVATGEEAVETDMFTGIRRHPHTSAGGKAILAYLPEDQVKEILDRRGLPEDTHNTITSQDELFSELEVIRDEGVAFDNQEHIEGIRSVAAPIQRASDVPHAAISLSAPNGRMASARFKERIPDRLGDIAQTVSIKLRYA